MSQAAGVEADALPQAREIPPRVNILGVGVMPLDLGRAVAILDQWRVAGWREYVCCVCVHGLVVAQQDPAMRRILNRSGLSTTDGMPLVWWCRRAGAAAARRVYGPDLLDAVCAYGIERGYRHYFYGATPEVIAKLVARLTARHRGLIVAGHHAPPFRPLTAAEQEADIAAINAAQPDFVWVGLGMPKQERWLAAHLGRIEATALLGVGAAFDFHAGTKPQAPRWMQRSGTEWLFRLACEPRRLAHRYFVGNTIFAALILQQMTGLRTFPLTADAADG